MNPTIGRGRLYLIGGTIMAAGIAAIFLIAPWSDSPSPHAEERAEH